MLSKFFFRTAKENDPIGENIVSITVVTLSFRPINRNYEVIKAINVPFIRNIWKMEKNGYKMMAKRIKRDKRIKEQRTSVNITFSPFVHFHRARNHSLLRLTFRIFSHVLSDRSRIFRPENSFKHALWVATIRRRVTQSNYTTELRGWAGKLMKRWDCELNFYQQQNISIVGIS